MESLETRPLEWRWWWLETPPDESEGCVFENQQPNSSETTSFEQPAKIAQRVNTASGGLEELQGCRDPVFNATGAGQGIHAKTRRDVKVWYSNQQTAAGDAESEEGRGSSASASSLASSSTISNFNVQQDARPAVESSSCSDVTKDEQRGSAALDATRMALSIGSASISTSSSDISDIKSNTDSGDNSSNGGTSDDDVGISDSSASVDELESSAADSSVSSLSIHSRVNKVSDPRHIENIPSLAVATGNVHERREDGNPGDSALTQCRTYSTDEFAQPETVVVAARTPIRAIVRDWSPCRLHKRKRGNEAWKVLARLQPQPVQVRSPVARPKRVVSEDPELFVKFNGLQGILLEHVPRRRGRFLDLGCGTSIISKEMVLHGYNRVFGIDVDAAKIQWQQDQCRELEGFVRFLHMDACAMRFPDTFFECVFTKAVLDMVAANYAYAPAITDDVDELRRILCEIYRCLQPGGVWILVSCHSARRSQCVLKSGLDTEERVRSPWWEWRGISEFIQSRFDRVKTYNVGTPVLEDGQRAKPFVATVFRRKETTYQHLERLCRIQHEEKRDEREFDVLVRWHSEKRRWNDEQDLLVRETRAMVSEDVMSRSYEYQVAYATAARTRASVREAIYKDVLERDRYRMAAEDAAAMALRAEWRSVAAFIATTLFAIADAALVDAVVTQARAGTQSELTRQANETASGVKTILQAAESATAPHVKHSAAFKSSTLSVAGSTQSDQPNPNIANSLESTVCRSTERELAMNGCPLVGDVRLCVNALVESLELLASVSEVALVPGERIGMAHSSHASLGEAAAIQTGSTGGLVDGNGHSAPHISQDVRIEPSDSVADSDDDIAADAEVDELLRRAGADPSANKFVSDADAAERAVLVAERVAIKLEVPQSVTDPTLLPVEPQHLVKNAECSLLSPQVGVTECLATSIEEPLDVVTLGLANDSTSPLKVGESEPSQSDLSVVDERPLADRHVPRPVDLPTVMNAAELPRDTGADDEPSEQTQSQGEDTAAKTLGVVGAVAAASCEGGRTSGELTSREHILRDCESVLADIVSELSRRDLAA